MIDAERMFSSSVAQPAAAVLKPTLATAVPVRADTIEGRLFPSSAPQPGEAATVSPEEAKARKMFPSMAQPAPGAATLATDDGAKPAAGEVAKPDFAAQIKAATPRDIADMRAASPDARAEKIYGDTAVSDAITEAVTNDTGTPENMRTPEVAVEWSKIARDIGIDDAETRYVTQRIGQLRLERATGETPISREAALKSTMDALTRQFDDPVQAFNDAAALARRDPRVARLLDRTGLGNDAEVIVMLAKRARVERINRRLK